MRYCGRIAYINHDLDAAMRAGILTEADVPAEIRDACGDRTSVRINSLLTDLITASGKGRVEMSEPMAEVFDLFHNFMFDSVYRNPKAKGEESKVLGIISGIFDYYMHHSDELPEKYLHIAHEEGLERSVCDYVAGMTDSFAMETYGRIFIPAVWTVK